MGARGHHRTHQLNSPALGILMVLPFLCVLLFQRLERDGRCPERMLLTMCSLGAIRVFPPPLASSQAWASFYFQASGKPLLFRAVNLPPVSNTIGEIWQH